MLITTRNASKNKISFHAQLSDFDIRRERPKIMLPCILPVHAVFPISNFLIGLRLQVSASCALNVIRLRSPTGALCSR